MRRSTVGTRPLPYWQAYVASGTGEAPTCCAGLGGEPGRDFDELPTACSALVGEHTAKLRVTSAGYTLPKDFGNGPLAIFRPDEPLIYGHQPTGEFMIAVLALIGKPLLESGCQLLPTPTLCLCESMCGLAELVWMGNLLPRGEGQQMMETRIYADFPSLSGRDGLRLCVDEQTEIPARRPFDDASTFDTPFRNILGMEPHMPDAWDVDTCLRWGFEGIREGNTRQLIPLAFEPWLLGQFLVTTVPGGIRRVEDALQRMTGDAELFAMVSQQIMKGILAVIDAVLGILFDLANGPIPDTGQVKKPGGKLRGLRGIETKLELPLDHLTPAFAVRCIV